jgi:signal transduction histidine kinase
MKLFTKYTRINLLIMVIVFLLSAESTYLLTNYALTREMDADLSGIRDRIRDYYGQYHQLPGGHALDEEQVTYEPTGQQMNRSEFTLITRYSQREQKMHNFRQLVFTLPAGDRLYKVTIAKPLEGLHHLFRAILLVSLATILTIILAFLLTNRILLRRLWQPFYDALHTMQHFKLGHTRDLHFPKTTTQEFAFMNESLGMATKKAEEDYLLLKEFTENASHELQTPLSIIRSKLEMLIQDEDLSERQSEIVRSAFAAIKKLSRLNQSLLLLTKISNRQFNHLEEIALKEKVEDKLRQFRELWQAGGIEVTSRLSPATIRASPELIDILLNNLFSNASNHNTPHGDIDIALEPSRLTISNTGLSVALDPRRMFNRFYKGEQHTGHNGLGLSIIKQICEVTSLEPAYRFSGNRHTFTFTW